MKPLSIFIGIIALLAVGFIGGRQTAPTLEAESGPKATTSKHTPRKATRVNQTATANASSVSPTDLDGLLELADSQMAFETSTKLRAALGDLESLALERLLTRLLESEESEPGYYQLRDSLLNHLVAQDPFRALDFVLAQDDKNFKTSNLHIIILAATKVDLAAARAAVAEIEDPSLKKISTNALLIPPKDATSEDLLDLLSTQKNQPYLNNYGIWGGSFYHSGISFGNSNGGALTQLAQKDLSAAESYASNLKTPNERNIAYSQIASALAQSDPQGALDWAKGFDASEGRSKYLSAAISAIATKDPQLAAAQLDELNDFQLKNHSISNIVHSWSQKDPQAAIAWIGTLKPGQAKTQAYQTVGSSLAINDPQAAIQLAEGLPSNYVKSMIPNILNQWANQDFDAAKNWLTSQDDPITLEAGFSTILHTWAQRDPAEAARFIEQAPPSANRIDLYNHLARQWVQGDREAALEWAQGIEHKESQNTVTQVIYRQWASQDPAGAVEIANTISDQNQKQNLLNSIATSWHQQDPETARAWVDTLPVNERFIALGSTLSSLSYSQPLEAAHLYDELLTERQNDESLPSRFASNASSIASSWSQHDPAAAAEWAVTLPDESQQANAFKNIASAWAKHDPTATSQWIDELPVGKARDEATSSFVQNISRIDPASAFEWADTINDDQSRYNSLRNTIDQWKRSDPEGALEAVHGVELTEKQREQLLERLE